MSDQNSSGSSGNGHPIRSVYPIKPHFRRNSATQRGPAATYVRRGACPTRPHTARAHAPLINWPPYFTAVELAKHRTCRYLLADLLYHNGLALAYSMAYHSKVSRAPAR